MISELSKDELMVDIYGTWHIWKERCTPVFEHTTLTEHQVLELIKEDLFILGSYLMEARKDDSIGARSMRDEEDGGRNEV
jgi:cob(I)alamin adenosyltransferase